MCLARFRSLWKTRYKVFPKIPRDVQRRIRSNELHLGYALPTPQLGNEIKEIPLAPWQPITLCSGECKHDSKVCKYPSSDLVFTTSQKESWFGHV